MILVPEQSRARRRVPSWHSLPWRSLLPMALLLATLGFALSVPMTMARAQAGTLRGLVTDTTGRPLANVEVLSINMKRSTRSGRDGRFVLTKLPFGQQLVMARMPGYQPAERAIAMLDDATPDITLQMRRVVQALDTLRIVSHDGCAAYDVGGFECRRRAGIGQFRGAEELAALRAYYWADMFEELPGLRRTPTHHEIIGADWAVQSTTGWRCLMEGWNGRHRTAAEENIVASEVVAIEHYDSYEKVPAAYKRLAWPTGQDKPCALVMYWTRAFVEHVPN